MNCPLCRGALTYEGFTSVACVTAACPNWDGNVRMQGPLIPQLHSLWRNKANGLIYIVLAVDMPKMSVEVGVHFPGQLPLFPHRRLTFDMLASGFEPC